MVVVVAVATVSCCYQFAEKRDQWKLEYAADRGEETEEPRTHEFDDHLGYAAAAAASAVDEAVEMRMKHDPLPETKKAEAQASA